MILDKIINVHLNKLGEFYLVYLHHFNTEYPSLSSSFTDYFSKKMEQSISFREEIDHVDYLFSSIKIYPYLNLIHNQIYQCNSTELNLTEHDPIFTIYTVS